MNDNGFFSSTGKAFGLVYGGFLVESLDDMMTWIIVMFAVIFCDLVSGVRCALIAGKHVRFSHAWRATLGKMLTYFSVVIMAVLIDKAAGGKNIDFWSIMFICFLEGCSIAGNILKPMGYNIDLGVIISVVMKKIFSIDKSDTDGMITKDNNNEKEQET